MNPAFPTRPRHGSHSPEEPTATSSEQPALASRSEPPVPAGGSGRRENPDPRGPHAPSRDHPTSAPDTRVPATQQRRFLYFVCLGLACIPIFGVSFPPVLDLPQQLHQIPLLFDHLRGSSPELAFRPFAPNRLGYTPLLLGWITGGSTWGPRLGLMLFAAGWLGALHWLGAKLDRSPSNVVLASLFLFSSSFYAGFFNFFLGMIPLAFWLVELRRPSRGRSWTSLFLASMLGTLLLYWTHALWFAFGGLVVASLVLLRGFEWRAFVARALGAVPVILLALAWAGRFGASGWQDSIRQELSPWERLSSLTNLSGVFFGGLAGPLERLTLFVLFLWFVLGIVRAIHDKGESIAWDLLLTGSFFLGLALVLPYKVDKTILFGWRWGAFAAVLLLLSVPPPRVRPRLALAFALTLQVAFVASTFRSWVAFDRIEMRGFRESLDGVRDGSRVLGLDFGRTSRFLRIAPFFQMFAYAGLERQVELSFSFTELPSSLVVRRDASWRPSWTLGLEWAPYLVSAGDLREFDQVLFNGSDVFQGKFASTFEGVQRVRGHGNWALFDVDRAAVAELPPDRRLYTGKQIRWMEDQAESRRRAGGSRSRAQ